MGLDVYVEYSDFKGNAMQQQLFIFLENELLQAGFKPTTLYMYIYVHVLPTLALTEAARPARLEHKHLKRHKARQCLYGKFLHVYMCIHMHVCYIEV